MTYPCQNPEFFTRELMPTGIRSVHIQVNCRELSDRNLLGSENSVASVAQTRNDVTVLVQMLVQGSDVDIYVRMCLLQLLYAFRSCDNAQETHILYAAILQHLDRRDGRTAVASIGSTTNTSLSLQSFGILQ